MSNLKPCICEWLHCAWKQVQNMKETIVKGWDNIGITKAFKNEFQLVAMEAKVNTSLFHSTSNIEEHNEINMEIDPAKTTLIIMEECFLQANVVTTSIAITSYTPMGSTRVFK